MVRTAWSALAVVCIVATIMSTGAVRCGELACQRDSYLRSLPAVRVISCNPRATAVVSKGKAEKRKDGCDAKAPLFDVVLSDTVLFPEGGGQPCDRGEVGGVPCIMVENVDGLAVHVVTAPLEEGSEVAVSVDWTRRWDHCTQHSTQHLLTALATHQWGIETLSWYLGESSSFLELGAPGFALEQAQELERSANEAIRAAHPVTPSWHDAGAIKDGKVEGLRKSAKTLPESVVGPVRVITIKDIDSNTCCGTHVQSTAHLSCIKLLRVEKSKTTTKLHFVAADRVLASLAASYDRELKLSSLLSVGATDLVPAVETLSQKQKALDKSVKVLTLELVEVLVASLRDKAAAGQRLLTVHRDASDATDFMRALGSALDETLKAGSGALLLCTLGAADGEGQGSFLLSGPPPLVAAASGPVTDALQGRGGGRGDRYQGKCARVSARAAAAAAADAAIASL